jgi:hypothetical protein
MIATLCKFKALLIVSSSINWSSPFEVIGQYAVLGEPFKQTHINNPLVSGSKSKKGKMIQ